MKTRQKQIDEQLPKPPAGIIEQLAELAPCFNKLDPDKFMAYIRGEDEPYPPTA